MGDPVLTKWQEQLIQKIIGEPDERKILWYRDPVGNKAKPSC